MVDVAHKNLSGDEIHEPKGISTALAGQIYVSDGDGSGTWTTLQEVDPAAIACPVGSVVEYAGLTAPSGWFFCYGQTVSRTTYSGLFDAIGTTYGVGDGETTFTLPDCRGRIIAGKDDMGGTSANRLTSPINGDNLGAAGGSQGHTLTASQVPPLTGSTSTNGNHTHSLTNGTGVVRRSGSAYARDSTSGYNDYTVSLASGGSHTHDVTVNSTGGESHSNVQPVIVFNTIIYHGVV